MKILKTTDIGGFPFVLDDLRWQAAGVLESIRALSRSLTPANAEGLILSGCEITETATNEYSIGAGWVYLKQSSGGDEEIFEVEAQNYIFDPQAPQNIPRWEDYTLYDAAGNKVFNSGLSYQTYAIRRLRIIITDNNAYPALSNTPPLVSDWINAVLVKGFTTVPNRNLQYRRKFNTVEFRGAIDGGAGLAFVLLPDFRPSILFETILQVAPPESATLMKKVTINISGQVNIGTNETGPDYTQTTIPMCFSMPL